MASVISRAWGIEREAEITHEIAIIRFREPNRLTGGQCSETRDVPSGGKPLCDIAFSKVVIEGQPHRVAGPKIVSQIKDRQAIAQSRIEAVGCVEYVRAI